MSALTADHAPTSERTAKATAPETVDRRTIAPREVSEYIRRAHKLPRRRAEWIARRCYREARIARAYLPTDMADALHLPASTFIRRAPRMVGTGETGRVDRQGVAV